MVDLSELADLADRLRRKGRTIVLTNGCFDLLHAGHLHLFSASRDMGDSLIVAIDDDASVKKLKGAGRPVIGERERIRTLCALDSIDHLVVYASGRLKDVIEAIRPDILTKGSNYEVAAVPGREEVEKHGGIAKIVPTEQGLSSSNIIERIKNTDPIMFDESD
jgi:D-beta-D-heptose 7-phosphate kinase/D-beta-D-heptose 1-phosphate adenosyltransferase